MRTHRLIHLLFLLLAFLQVKSQTIDSTFGELFSFSQLPNAPIPSVTACDFELRDDRAYSAIFLEDGKIILAGHSSGDDGCDFAFARLLPDGQFDQSAGPDGQVRLNLGFSNDSCLIGASYSNSILLAGCATPTGQSGYSNLIVKTDIDGNMDTNFGTLGMVLIDLPSDNEMVTKMVVQPDGKILIAGNMYFGQTMKFADSTFIFLSRLMPDGSIDDSFGTDGFLYQHSGICASTLIGDMKLAANGDIIITGGGFFPYPDVYFGEGIYCSHKIFVYKYLSNGMLDSTFGQNGRVNFQYTIGKGEALYVYDDGRIVVAGVTGDDLVDQIYTYVARLMPNGTLDSTFNDDGYFFEYLLGEFGFGSEVFGIQEVEGELILGYNDGTKNNHLTFGVICMDDTGHLNPNFGQDGIFTFAGKLPIVTYLISDCWLSTSNDAIYFVGTYSNITHKNMMICKLNINPKGPSIENEEQRKNDLLVFPNPCKDGIVHIRYAGNEFHSKARFILRDFNGRIVTNQNINLQNFDSEMNLLNLNSGMYFWEINEMGRTLQTGKLVLIE